MKVASNSRFALMTIITVLLMLLDSSLVFCFGSIPSAYRQNISLYAKGSKERKSTSAPKGFNKVPPNLVSTKEDKEILQEVVEKIQRPNLPEESKDLSEEDRQKRVNELIQNYVGTKAERRAAKKSANKSKKSKPFGSLIEADENRPFGEAVLAKIPDSVQERVDGFLITGTFIALFVVVSCGIGISLGAFRVVFPTIVIPPEVENFSMNILDPAFTPSVLVFFAFSITLGVFKYAQISSDRTVYRENEEDNSL